MLCKNSSKNFIVSSPFYTISSFAFFTGSKLYIRIDCLQLRQNIPIQPHAACKRILGNLSQCRGQFHANEIYASGKSTGIYLLYACWQLNPAQAAAPGKVPWSISVMPDGSLMLRRLLQYLKAYSPIATTVPPSMTGGMLRLLTCFRAPVTAMPPAHAHRKGQYRNSLPHPHSHSHMPYAASTCHFTHHSFPQTKASPA